MVSAFSANSKIPATAGIGLRGEHYTALESELPAIGWLEVHSENYFGAGGLPHHYLELFRQHYPLSFHGVGLSIGSTDALDKNHLNHIKRLIERYEPGLVSEHLSWSSFNGMYTNDLLPFPYTGESLQLFSNKVAQIQEFLGRTILVENPSTYLTFDGQELSETEFINELCSRTGCGLLLDVNNVYVCACNHDFDPINYIDSIVPSNVGEIHLAGHSRNTFDDGSMLIDSHNNRICNEVWDLFRYTVRHIGNKPTLIEWDTDLPQLETLLDEAGIAQEILDGNHALAA